MLILRAIKQQKEEERAVMERIRLEEEEKERLRKEAAETYVFSFYPNSFATFYVLTKTKSN